ncbi:MAG: hypothetical protein JSU94_03455 [Phycisphaerales bacterium]|nr:MAG: hypothetical protein JSU94_03455 [Phycisphaerales bacterium]
MQIVGRMKRIELPISRSFATRPIDIWEARKKLASGECTKIPLGSIDFSCCGKELDQARTNGGLIIWSAICLEQKLERVITRYMFPNTEAPNGRGRKFFESNIVKGDILSYAAKKRLAVNLVNDAGLLKGKDKDEFSRVLKKVMDFRNAFAHGGIEYIVVQAAS